MVPPALRCTGHSQFDQTRQAGLSAPALHFRGLCDMLVLWDMPQELKEIRRCPEVSLRRIADFPDKCYDCGVG
jgi:hypothetical protein